jgi:hypothetical protein
MFCYYLYSCLRLYIKRCGGFWHSVKVFGYRMSPKQHPAKCKLPRRWQRGRQDG